jgi:hypothetical protein
MRGLLWACWASSAAHSRAVMMEIPSRKYRGGGLYLANALIVRAMRAATFCSR